MLPFLMWVLLSITAGAQSAPLVIMLPLSVVSPQPVIGEWATDREVKTEVARAGRQRVRYVTTSSRGVALGGQAASGDTNVSAAEVMPPSQLAVQRAVKLPHPEQRFRPVLNFQFWRKNLGKIYEPDTAHSLLSQLNEGVLIGRPPADTQIISPNWPSALEYRDQVTRIIEDDLDAGRLYGPFRDPPFDCFIVSPLGAFPKKGSSKVRLIHDLSFPTKGSVNSHIKREDFSLNYSSVDDATRICKELGQGSVYMAKLDLENAFKHIFVKPCDWHLLGFTWPDVHGRNQFYFSKVLNFGLRSAPYLFDQFASALLEFMYQAGVPRRVVRYVDDFIVLAPTAEQCQDSLDIMLKTCLQAGFAVQPSKITAPATVAEFLGIVIDSDLQLLRISADRLRDLSQEVNSWLGTKRASKRQLLSLLGKLSFAAKVVRTGRAFIGRLLAAAKSAKALHHHVKINEAARADLQWWSSCIATHNGISYYNPSFTGDDVMHVYSDASNTAFGAVCGNEWFQMAYVGTLAPFLEKSINWREFHAALAALATWATSLRGKAVVFHIDNQVVCHILNKLYSPVKELMYFTRQWCLLIEKFNISPAVVYIDTAANIDADDLSRLKTQDFLNRNPDANRHMTWPLLDDLSSRI